MSNEVNVTAPNPVIISTLNELAESYDCEPGYSCPPMSEYSEALEKLAELGKYTDDSCVESDDFEKLNFRFTMPLLADLIEHDPYFKLLLKRDQTLTNDKTKIASKYADGSEAIPEEHYGRLVYLMEVALRHLVGDLPKGFKVDGEFDDATEVALASFQMMMGIEVKEAGVVADKETLGLLVMHTRYTKSAMLDKLAETQDVLHKEGSFYYWDPNRKNAPKYIKDAREAIVDAMVWLGLENIDLKPHSTHGEAAMQKHFGQDIALVGVKVMQRIIDKVNEAE